MSISTARYFRAIEKLTTATRDELKGFIDRSKLNIPKNISTAAMREALIKIIVDRYKAEVDKNRAAAAKYIASARKAADKRKYFVTYQMRIFVGQGGYFTNTLYSFISSKRDDKNEARAKFVAWADANGNKAYPDELEAIEQVSSMNIPLKNAAERRALESLTGVVMDNKPIAARKRKFSDTIVQLKLDQRLYREIRKIDGFPDTFDKGDGMCVPNYLALETGKSRASIDRWFKKKYADDQIFQFFGAEEFPFSARDIINYAADHDCSYYLVDRKNYCFSYGISQKQKGKALYALIEDSHVYPITNASARNSISSKVREAAEHSSGNSAGNAKKYKNKKIDEINYWVPVVRDEDIFEISDKGVEIKCGGSWLQTTGTNLNCLLKTMLMNKILPTIEYSAGNITKIKYEGLSVAINPEYDAMQGTGYDSSSALAVGKFEELCTENPVVMGSIYGRVASAKYWIKETISPETHIGLDFSKFYYNCALKLRDEIPVFSVGSKRECSRFVDDGSYYYVITDDIKLFRGSDYYTCELIRLAIEDGIEFTIDHKLVPTAKYDPSLIKEKLNDIVNVFGDLNKAKAALVRFIGMLARSKTTKKSTYLIPKDVGNESSVLYHYLTELSRGREVQVHVDAFPDTVLVESVKNTMHSVSAESAHRAIMNRSYIEMYKLSRSVWDHIIGMKTDCMIFRKGSVDLDELVKSTTIPMKIEVPRACEPVEMNLPVATPIKKREITFHRESEYIKQFWKSSMFPSESEFAWMNLLIDDVIRDLLNGKFVRIEAIAGAGKSYIANEITRVLGSDLKIMSLAPDWVAARNIGGSTFHTRFHLGNDSTHWFKNITCCELSETVIIIDEVSKLDRNLIGLVDYLRTKAFAVIVLGDCEHQLLPVEKSDISVEESLAEFVDSMYTLEVCKRGRDIMEPALKVFDGMDSVSAGYTHTQYSGVEDLAQKYVAGDFQRLICKSNATRNEFNMEVAKIIGKSRESRKLTLTTQSSVSETKQITVDAFVGMELVSICNNKKLNLFKSDRGVIVNLNPFTVSINGREIVFEEKKSKKNVRYLTDDLIVVEKGSRRAKTLSEQLDGVFDIGYAITCYKSQSATYEFKYLIIDFESMCKREKFVATTRGTKLENIIIAELI